MSLWMVKNNMQDLEKIVKCKNKFKHLGKALLIGILTTGWFWGEVKAQYLQWKVSIKLFFFASDLFSIQYFNLLRLVFYDLDSFIKNLHEATYV